MVWLKLPTDKQEGGFFSLLSLKNTSHGDCQCKGGGGGLHKGTRSSVEYTVFGHSRRITGGFRNNFQNDRRLAEQHLEPQAATRKPEQVSWRGLLAELLSDFKEASINFIINFLYKRAAKYCANYQLFTKVQNWFWGPEQKSSSRDAILSGLQFKISTRIWLRLDSSGCQLLAWLGRMERGIGE